MTRRAVTGAAVFDGQRLHQDKALLLEEDRFRSILPLTDVANDCEVIALDGGTLLPGFIDLQVNGGGGVMFNDDTSVEGLRTIAEAHASTGTRALLPTLITDTPERSRAAIDAVEGAISQGVPGIVGLHLEGPHLSLARKGAHDPALIRPMTADDEEMVLDAARRLPNLMVTIAPESVSCEQIARLSAAGIIVSLGHTDCSFADAQAAFAAGASSVTHLFNAMSQLGNREPGLVGATLAAPGVSAGLIADGIHVHPASISAALDAKTGPGSVFLVTDAMSTVGSSIGSFELNGRTVLRRDGRLTLADGTLAGADLEMSTAIAVLRDKVGIDCSRALAMATSGPAALLRDPMGHGILRSGADTPVIHLASNGRHRPLPV